MNRALEFGQLPRAHFVNHPAKFLNLFAEPFKLFLGDAIVLRIARFDVGFFELLEARAVLPRVARPDIGKPRIDPLSLGAQEAEIMHVRGVESAYEQDGIVEAFTLSLIHS